MEPPRQANLCCQPPSGHHTADPELIREALAAFIPSNGSAPASEPPEISPTLGGANNVTVRVTVGPDRTHFILRIYNNGNNSDKVRFEHEVLRQLHEQFPLSFQLPKAVPTFSPPHSTHVLLSSGAEACLFHVIPGTLAGRGASPEALGRAAGELCAAMAQLPTSPSQLPPPLPPLFDLYAAHPAICSAAAFDAAVASTPGFRSSGESSAAMDFLVKEIHALDQEIMRYKSLGLPLQLTHGDLHYDNVLVDVLGGVTGLLDFEFCTLDWRAMDLAIPLSKYVGEGEPLKMCNPFVSGFVKHVELTPTEAQAMPDLINLRILSNVIYFVGRVVAGEDGLESLISRVGVYARRVRWVQANRAAIVDMIVSLLPATTAA